MRVFGALIALALVSQTGCSALSGFHRDWRSGCCASQGGITGCWDGCWESRCTGHHGKVRAIITRCDDTRYRARFHGTFFKVIPFGYEMTLTAVSQEGQYVLSGQKNLGRLAGGVYRFQGHATDSEFYADYTSDNDRGTFIMSRVNGGCSCRR